MSDWAHDWTDEQIEKLERRFRRAYSQAAREMRKKVEAYLTDYAKQNAQWMRDVRDGKATKKEWDAWKRDMATDRQFMAGLTETLAKDATRTNQLAFDMINDALPSVAAENANYAAYGIESRLGYDTHSFDLVDQGTVRRMMGLGDDGQILHEVIPQGETPNVPWQSVRVDMRTAKDVQWNRQKFNSALTQSILQGESIPNMAKRLMRVLNMDQNMATRAARTAMTGAENAGRTDSYKRAERIGIRLEQEWMATLDERTRTSHRQLDGQHVPVGEKFKVDGHEIEFPGDPTAPGYLIWNCRCTLVAWMPEIEQEDNTRWSRLPEGMTYGQWKTGKQKEQKRKDANGIVDGKNILGTWRRRPDKFDFEIDDVLNAQGFDGKPRVVSAEEFDEAVKAANEGNGFIAQRTYSAPNQETLDAYRQMLYNGKFYVDCSTGGAQYGQGMYCAADYTGRITDGIRREMQHYIDLGRTRNPLTREELELLEKAKRQELANLKVAKRLTPDQKKAYLWIELDDDFAERKDWEASGKLARLYQEADKVASAITGERDRLQAMHDWQLAERYPEIVGKRTYVETLTLDQSAKVITYSDLQHERTGYLEKLPTIAKQGAIEKHAGELGDAGVEFARRLAHIDEFDFKRMNELYDQLTPEQQTLANLLGDGRHEDVTSRITQAESMDLGSFAAAMGYDAINAEGHGDSGSYTVVLNRTKLIIRRPE